MAVFVEHGKGGSSVAGPMARQILDAWLLQDDGQLKPEYLPDLNVPLISSREP